MFQRLLPNVSINLGDCVFRRGLVPATLINGHTTQLVTAQRVLSETLVADHVPTVRQWMSHADPDGKLIIDVPHPDRRIGLEWIGKNGRPGLHTRPQHEYCFQIADEETWEECRAYARQLAEQAHLTIEGTMVAQRPLNGITDKLPSLYGWIAERRPHTMTGILSRDEVDWFRRDYISQFRTYGRSLGYEVQYDTAAVIVVFSRSVAFSAPGPTG